jgi:flagellar biosynthesis protein FlhG
MPCRDGNQAFDQAAALRRLMGRPSQDAAGASGRPHIIAVVSGKGGVGKTFIACNLSIALAARGHRVVLFDLDMGLANADIVLGTEPGWTWADVIRGRRTLEQVVTQAPGGIGFVPGGSGLAELANLSEFERHQLTRAIQGIEDSYDVVVLDCGAGISRNVVSLAAAADTIMVVATPEPTSMTDAYATIKTLVRQRDAENASSVEHGAGVVVNTAATRREARQTYERLADVAARFLHIVLDDHGYILTDEHVPIAIRYRSPVLVSYPRCAASCCFMAMAGRLSREIGGSQVRQSLFSRMMRLFL